MFKFEKKVEFSGFVEWPNFGYNQAQTLLNKS